MNAEAAVQLHSANEGLSPEAADRMLAELGARARAAAKPLAQATPAQKTAALRAAAAATLAASGPILEANEKDMAAGRAKGLAGSMLDRLQLDEARLDGMALEGTAWLLDLNVLLSRWQISMGQSVNTSS